MKVLKYGLLAIAAAWVLSGCSVHLSVPSFDTCQFQDDRSAVVPVDGAKLLTVLADTGSLRIEGRPGLTEVRVTGTACATTQNLLDRIELRAEKMGDTVRVEAIIPGFSGMGRSPSLDLTLEVPETMVTRVEDQSGDLTVRNVAGLEVDDESGSMVLDQITGPIRVTDESGDIEIRDARDGVLIDRDQSGSIRISKVQGHVDIDRDESGDIDIDDVSGSVTITEDQSGSIDVRNVKEDFTVKRDGSGDIRYSNVGRTVSIPRK